MRRSLEQWARKPLGAAEAAAIQRAAVAIETAMAAMQTHAHRADRVLVAEVLQEAMAVER